MKDKQEQIEKMAKAMYFNIVCGNKSCSNCYEKDTCRDHNCATRLYNQSYRKASDVIDEFLDLITTNICPTSDYEGVDVIHIIKELAAEMRQADLKGDKKGV
jgi:hypothetical protein|nr:MAG TPA: hypothetical protein [Caudoviricetes sp.]